MSRFPEPGDERFTLVPMGGGYDIERFIFADGGPSHFYDDESKDFVTVEGEWVYVQRFGPFADREEATKYMLTRGES